MHSTSHLVWNKTTDRGSFLEEREQFGGLFIHWPNKPRTNRELFMGR